MLTTPIFDFHKVISALTTPLTIPTPNPSLVKTSNQPRVQGFSLRKWKGWDGENTEDEVARERNIRVKGFFVLFLFLWHVL